MSYRIYYINIYIIIIIIKYQIHTEILVAISSQNLEPPLSTNIIWEEMER